MGLTFRKAERRRAKLRLGISGAAGSGKTFSALQVAFGLGGKVALIDTEAGSGELYSHLGAYDVLQLGPPFTPDRYVEALHAAEAAGYETVIIDSLSHAWAGEGGVLDMQGKIADSGKGNGFAAWRTVTPLQNRLVAAILGSPCHVIATMRAKTEYVLVEDRGKQVPKKVGMAPVQREGVDYEFTVFLEVGADHSAVATKDRTGILDGRVFRPDRDTGRRLLEWLDGGQAPLSDKETDWHDANRTLWKAACTAAPNLEREAVASALNATIAHVFGVAGSQDLSSKQLLDLAERIAREPGALGKPQSAAAKGG